MQDVTGRTIVEGDRVFLKHSYGETLTVGTVVGFTPKMVKVVAENYLGDMVNRNLNHVAVITDKTEEEIEWMKNMFNNLI